MLPQFQFMLSSLLRFRWEDLMPNEKVYMPLGAALLLVIAFSIAAGLRMHVADPSKKTDLTQSSSATQLLTE